MKELKPYPKTKDSGIPWLGEIPVHWDVRRSKYILVLIDERSSTGNEELLSVSEKLGVAPRKETNVTMFQAQSYIGYKLCKPKDLVINSLWAWMNGLGFSKYYGIISTAYSVYRLKESKKIDPIYGNYLLRSKTYNYIFRLGSKGIWRSRSQLSDDFFLSIPILLPPLTEQETIARYLDWKTSKIHKFIRNKKKLIGLLKEQKQNIINEAVTKGNNPNVKMKESGVEWIGEIPEHWEVSKNKAIYSQRKETGSDDLPILSVSIHNGVSKEEQSGDDNVRAKVRIEDKTKYSRVYPNDIAFNMMRAWQGGIGVVYVTGQVSPAYIVARPKKYINSLYIEYLFRTPKFIQEMNRNSRGTTDFRKRLYWDEYKNISLMIPPLEEQQIIVEYIEKETLLINQAIARTEKEISLIQEYHSRLVADVVTGKWDVRHVEIPDFETGTDESDSFEEEEIEDLELEGDEG